MRLRGRTLAIDSHDVGALRSASLRSRVLRIALVAAAVVLLGLTAAASRGLEPAAAGLLKGSASVVVIDLSASIGNEEYDDIRATLRRLIDADAEVGLVVFSDVGYELLPPGTPAAELRPLLRLFTPRSSGPPMNPWAGIFRAGTRISLALQLGRDILVRDGFDRGSVLLVSDLITAPEDVSGLARTLGELRRQSISVRVVALKPLRQGRQIFEGLLGKSALLEPSKLQDPPQAWTSTEERLPIGFLVLGAALLAALAVHEGFTGRLGLPRPAREPS
jgi:hypothetical protein